MRMCLRCSAWDEKVGIPVEEEVRREGWMIKGGGCKQGTESQERASKLRGQLRGENKKRQVFVPNKLKWCSIFKNTS